jgi:hypothetical protein
LLFFTRFECSLIFFIGYPNPKALTPDSVRNLFLTILGSEAGNKNAIDLSVLTKFVNLHCNAEDMNELVRSIWADQRMKYNKNAFEISHLQKLLSDFGIQITDEEAAEFMLHYSQVGKDDSKDKSDGPIGLNSEEFINMLSSSLSR